MSALLKPTKRRYVFAAYLLSGFLPWGRDFRFGREERPSIGRWKNCSTKRWEWPLCCGHAMSDAEVKAWTDAGLVTDAGPDRYGGRHIFAGPQLEDWTCQAFEQMGMRSRKAA